MMKKMSKLEKKVAIAKDVLKWLDTGKFYAGCGVYFVESEEERPEDKGLDGKEFQEWLKEVDECQVCARGAIFAAAVMRFDGVPSKDFVFDAGGPLSVEHRWFTKLELTIIEHLYEVWNAGIVTWPKSLDQLDVSYIPEEIRMRLIMEDIIEAGGRVRRASIVKRYEKWLKET